MLQQAASRLLVPAVRSAIQSRSQSVVCGPPTKHVPKGELYALGSLIVVSVVATPAWVLCHIREYRGGAK